MLSYPPSHPVRVSFVEGEPPRRGHDFVLLSTEGMAIRPSTLIRDPPCEWRAASRVGTAIGGGIGVGRLSSVL